MNAKRDRDQSIERLLKQPLAAGDIGPGLCLDAETAAAWLDGALRAEELATVEAHISSCTRCQAMIASVVRLPPADAPRGSWLDRWAVRWLVPLAACGIAVGLWIALPGRPVRDSSTAPAAQRFAAEPSQPQPEARPDRAQPSIPGRGEVASGPTDTLTRETQRRQSAMREPEQRGQAESGATADERAKARVEQQVPRVEEQVLARGDVAVPRQQAANEGNDSLGKLAAPAPPASPALAPAQTESIVAPAAASKRDAAAIEIPSSDRAVRWRIGAAGLVQRSTDGGLTWDVISTGVAADLLAGASPSPSVCWVVGRAGTVLLILDGRRVQRVPFAEAVDLTSVRATDERAAVVTTARGRSFSTNDGGATWTPRAQ